MATPIWFAQLLKVFFPYRKKLARLTHLPVFSSLADWMFFKDDMIVYLPKDHIVVREAIDLSGGMPLPSTLVDHFIKEASYHWLMNACICREGDDCQHYPHDLGCLFLGEAVMKINPKLGRLVSKEEALAHVHRARELGLVQMIGRDRIDSVWLGARPSAKLMTICNCCSCCCLFRILPDLKPALSQRITRLPGVEVWVDPESCVGCGKCSRESCFVEAISLVHGKAQISADCRGCGRCVEICPQRAIHLRIEDEGYITHAIQRISSLVDVNGRTGH